MDTTAPVPTPLTGTKPPEPVAPPRERTLLRVAGGALAATALAILFLEPVEGPALETATGEQALAHLVETAGTRELLVTVLILQTVVWLVAVVSVRAAFHRRQPGAVWGDLVLASGVLVTTSWWMIGAVQGVPAVVDLAVATPANAQQWYALEVLASSYSDIALVAQVVFSASLGAAGLRTRLLHRPVAWFAVVVAACPVLSLAAELAGVDAVSTALFYAGLFGFVLVLAAGGASLLVRGRH
jgi:hypothetical protein